MSLTLIKNARILDSKRDDPSDPSDILIADGDIKAVSYTHLTLPTIYSV